LAPAADERRAKVVQVTNLSVFPGVSPVIEVFGTDASERLVRRGNLFYRRRGGGSTAIGHMSFLIFFRFFATTNVK